MELPELCLMGSEVGENEIEGPCWEDYVYVGPKPRKKGSCIRKDKLCKKKTSRAKGYSCKIKLTKNGKLNCKTNKTKAKAPIKNEKILNRDKYDKCLIEAGQRFSKGKIKLCPRGYCTAKNKFEVYPSAYANGYATSVCKGDKPDALENTIPDKEYIKKLEMRKKKSPKKTDSLKRWYNEEWVNLCEKGNGPGGFAVCGSGKGINNPDDYPYCRAYYKLPGTKVVTVEELKDNLSESELDDLIKKMCSKKRSLEQGINGKPTRIKLPNWVYKKIKDNRKQKGGNWHVESNKLVFKFSGGSNIKIPKEVRKAAKLGNRLVENGFAGGTKTGWNRGNQLATDKDIDVNSLADMRTWFARHGPDAKNGGTSYPGFCKWLSDGKPMNKGKSKYRGAVSWLIWGGDAAYEWLKSDEIRSIIEAEFPKRKKSSNDNNLGC